MVYDWIGCFLDEAKFCTMITVLILGSIMTLDDYALKLRLICKSMMIRRT